MHCFAGFSRWALCDRRSSLAWFGIMSVLSLFVQSCTILPQTPISNSIRTSVSTRPGYMENRKADVVTPYASNRPPLQLVNVHTGDASWYGPGFHGKKTASGEIFDQAKFTAAHRTFPLGSRARVTHLENGNSIEVEINDRGPYVAGRIIDLSRAAARALGIIQNGTARVRVELIAEPTAKKYN